MMEYLKIAKRAYTQPIFSMVAVTSYCTGTALIVGTVASALKVFAAFVVLNIAAVIIVGVTRRHKK